MSSYTTLEVDFTPRQPITEKDVVDIVEKLRGDSSYTTSILVEPNKVAFSSTYNYGISEVADLLKHLEQYTDPDQPLQYAIGEIKSEDINFRGTIYAYRQHIFLVNQETHLQYMFSEEEITIIDTNLKKTRHFIPTEEFDPQQEGSTLKTLLDEEITRLEGVTSS